MPRKQRIVFKITPQTHVRATQADALLFRIPEDQLKAFDKGEMLMARKYRLIQYNEYKRDLRMIAEFLSYTMAPAGSHFTFFLPVSKSWTGKKKASMHNQPHEFKPDADNLIKAFKDALMKQDSSIWDYRVTKRWTNAEEGRIEIGRILIR